MKANRFFSVGVVSASMLMAQAMTGSAWATDYQIEDSHAAAHFSVRHLMVSNVRGQFTKIQGKVSYDPANVAASKVEATIDAGTVNTQNEKRDEHLRSPDFLETSKFPLMKFVSKKVEAAGKGRLKVTGDLTLHGVTKEVVLDVDGPSDEVTDPWGKVRRGATATAKINRKDFGLNWSKALETGGVVVGDEVQITLEIEMVKVG